MFILCSELQIFVSRFLWREMQYKFLHWYPNFILLLKDFLIFYLKKYKQKIFSQLLGHLLIVRTIHIFFNTLLTFFCCFSLFYLLSISQAVRLFHFFTSLQWQCQKNDISLYLFHELSLLFIFFFSILATIRFGKVVCIISAWSFAGSYF